PPLILLLSCTLTLRPPPPTLSLHDALPISWTSIAIVQPYRTSPTNSWSIRRGRKPARSCAMAPRSPGLYGSATPLLHHWRPHRYRLARLITGAACCQFTAGSAEISAGSAQRSAGSAEISAGASEISAGWRERAADPSV